MCLILARDEMSYDIVGKGTFKAWRLGVLSQCLLNTGIPSGVCTFCSTMD